MCDSLGVNACEGDTTDYSRLYRLVAARRDQGDADELGEWRGADVGALALLLGGRVLRGSLLRARMAHAEGLVFADRNVRLLHGGYVTAGRDLNLEEGCQIMGLSRRGIVFGDRCTIGRFAMVAPTNTFGGEPGEGLKLGDHSNIGPFAYLGCSGYIEIGARVLMGPRVTLIAENHNFDELGLPIKDQGVERRAIKVDDDCWLGAGSTILAGVTVGSGAVVAAGAVVAHDVPPLTVVAGVPARVVRERTVAP